jgi:hypothetical protein
MWVFYFLFYLFEVDFMVIIDIYVWHKKNSRDCDDGDGVVEAEKNVETRRQQSRVCISPSSLHRLCTVESLARELVVKRREANGERLQRRHWVLKIHVEAVLADLAELEDDRLGCQ